MNMQCGFDPLSDEDITRLEGRCFLTCHGGDVTVERDQDFLGWQFRIFDPVSSLYGSVMHQPTASACCACLNFLGRGTLTQPMPIRPQEDRTLSTPKRKLQNSSPRPPNP